ncbi:TetR/AcrR family transcriptional regulator [Cellulomonas chengniuliangii]|uniref:TetR/AcrR family transcriptional regulator n=1 Tax=Cellulomonas chengniuliangii TaxID=2968084 RepID=UPI001D0F240D|nr:TetR/AcrR family transcriptional regulator [Cellulomonas chengniuliangii]MCC2317694.1 TetR/AcrR family transcriptional regulator [Cellulomonas chengniuliangii]
MPVRSSARSRRAPAMAPDDRRAAILEAVGPLLRERGAAVTTRELAAAACVAEGTLFRVFPDKETLVRAAVAHALDPADVVAKIAAIPDDEPLRPALREAVRLMQDRARQVVDLLVVAHHLPGGPHPANAHAHGAPPGGGRHRHPAMEPVVGAMARLLSAHAGELRRPPQECAHVLLALVLSTQRTGMWGDGVSLKADDLVDIALNGLVIPGEA